jgi:hypothetical protein
MYSQKTKKKKEKKGKEKRSATPRFGAQGRQQEDGEPERNDDGGRG